MTFKELQDGSRFVFVGSQKVCVKTGPQTFRVEADDTPGRVGVGDNPVTPH